MPTRSSRAKQTLIENYINLYPNEAANKLENQTVKEIIRLIETHPKIRAVSVVENLTPDLTARIIEQIKEELPNIPITGGSWHRLDLRRVFADKENVISEVINFLVEKEEKYRAFIGDDPVFLYRVMMIIYYSGDEEGEKVLKRLVEKDYSPYYDMVADEFGHASGLVALDKFPPFLKQFAQAYNGREHYFRAVLAALSKRYYDHGLAIADAAKTRFEDSSVVQDEVAALPERIEKIKKLRATIDARKEAREAAEKAAGKE